jgi:hypothetical protein
MHIESADIEALIVLRDHYGRHVGTEAATGERTSRRTKGEPTDKGAYIDEDIHANEAVVFVGCNGPKHGLKLRTADAARVVSSQRCSLTAKGKRFSTFMAYAALVMVSCAQ